MTASSSPDACAGGFQLLGVAGKLQQVPGAKPGVVLLEAVGVGQHADALAGVDAGSDGRSECSS